MDPRSESEAKRLLAIGWDRIAASTEHIYSLNILFQKVKDQGTACCPDTVLKPFYYELESMFTEKKTTMLTNNFKLKEGEAPFLRSLGDFVSNKSLTDALALALLDQDANNKRFFQKLPDDLDAFRASLNSESTSEANGESTEAPSLKVNLKKLTKNELLIVAEGQRLPVEEYENLNKEKLIEYLTEKIK